MEIPHSDHSLSENSPEIPKSDDVEVVVIPLLTPSGGVPPLLSTPDEFAAAAHQLRMETGPIAIDTERASGFRYSGRAYLVQLKRGSTNLLIDPIEHPEALTELIETADGPEWIVHAADQDLPSLRELGFSCAELFDTELAGRLLGLPRVNLAEMVRTFLGLGLAKGHGAADWSRRPLPENWLNYAALDVEVLIELRNSMADALDQAGKLAWAREEFEHIRTLPPSEPRAERWRRTAKIHTVKSARGLAIVRELWTLRESIAVRRDIAPGKILADSALVDAALAAPQTIKELLAIPPFNGPRQSRNAHRWFTAIAHAYKLPTAELPTTKVISSSIPPANRWETRNPEAALRLTASRAALTEISETLSVPVENILLPELLRRICWEERKFTSLEVDEYLEKAGARNWQREIVVEKLTAALTVAN